MADTVTLTHRELDRRLDQAHREGIIAGRVAERLGIGVEVDESAPLDHYFPGTTPGDFPRPMSVVEANRPNLRLVPTDQHTAEVFHLPINPNEKTAS